MSNSGESCRDKDSRPTTNRNSPYTVTTHTTSTSHCIHQQLTNEGLRTDSEVRREQGLWKAGSGGQLTPKKYGAEVTHGAYENQRITGQNLIF